MDYSTKNTFTGRIFDYLGFNDKFHKFFEDPIEKNDDVFVSPVEATVVASGKIGKDGEIVSKFGSKLKIAEAVGCGREYFSGGTYLNLYLSPKDRHYWRMPFDCKLVSAKINEGKALFPVIIGLDNFFGSTRFFEKAVKTNASIGQILETKYFRFIMIPVGSFNVNRIHIINENDGIYNKGDVGGYFSAGSSVLICFPDYPLDFLVKNGDKLNIGEPMAKIRKEVNINN